ncbi:MAG: hypothetical protein JNK11_06980 [Alphaproteobacteria bacterium]|nr:hypothetical protein [Alphaproteobacteria bacterium]
MRRLFSEHPASVGETYVEHMGMATSFGLRMVGAGFACLLHGLFPFLFVRTGSKTIQQLHQEMCVARDRRAALQAVAQPSAQAADSPALAAR